MVCGPDPGPVRFWPAGDSLPPAGQPRPKRKTGDFCGAEWLSPCSLVLGTEAAQPHQRIRLIKWRPSDDQGNR
jgi:hypothetical protein